MRKETVNFTLDGEDVKLIKRLKETLRPTHGKVSNTAVIRMALRKMEQNADTAKQ
jgi:hypothetical protein